MVDDGEVMKLIMVDDGEVVKLIKVDGDDAENEEEEEGDSTHCLGSRRWKRRRPRHPGSVQFATRENNRRRW